MPSNLLRFKLSGLSFLDSVRSQPCRFIEMTDRPTRELLVWQPDVIGHLFRSDRTMTMDGSSTIGPLVGRHSLLYANGPRHASYRRVIGGQLRGAPLASYRPTIEKIAHEQIDAGMTPGTVVDVPAWTRLLTFRVICHILFGETDIPVLRPFTSWVESALGSPRRTLTYRYLRPSLRWPSTWRTFLRHREQLCQDILDLVRQRPGEGLAHQLADGTTRLDQLSDEDLTDQVVSLLFAGHETTASSLAWALYWIDQHDDLRRDLVDEVTGTPGDGSSPEDFPLLDATCRESLRITPPATLAGNRILNENTDLLDQSLTAGTRLTPCIYLAHRNPELFANPHRFDATRFLDTRMSAQAYLPFGGGVRRCLGADLAMLELRMVLAAVLRRRTVRLADPNDRVGPQARGPAMGPGPRLLMAVTEPDS